MNYSRRWLFHRELIREPIGQRLERRSTHGLTCGRDASALSEICERLLKEPLLPPVGQVVELMATIHRAKGTTGFGAKQSLTPIDSFETAMKR
jgi:hypothetical protein